MLQAVCNFCKSEGRIREVCKTCKRCLYHSHGCVCMKCGLCCERLAPKDICMKCMYCKAHHVEGEVVIKEFPLRRCKVKLDTCVKCKTSAGLCKGCKNCKTCKRACECPVYHLNPLPRSLGVELEIAQWNHFNEEPTQNSHIKWQFEHDGSVTSGQELVTGIMQGDQFIYGMTELCAKLKEFKCTADSTCGFHVHVDAAQYSAFDLRRVMLGFWSIQKGLFSTLVSKTREKNIYCPPVPMTVAQAHELAQLTSAGAINNWFYRYLYGLNTDTEHLTASERLTQRAYITEKLNHIKAHKYENAARRQAINFHSWMMRGTIEFRLKEGTVEAEDVLMWPLWCGWFIHKLGLMDDKEVFAWMKTPPSILNLSRRFAERGKLGSVAMPESVLKWVEKKTKLEEPKPKKDSLDIFADAAMQRAMAGFAGPRRIR